MDGEKGTLKVPENFDISNIDLLDIPEDIVFPDELNRFFREQIRYYIHENGMLKKNLSDYETDSMKSRSTIEELKSKLKNYERDGNGMLNSTQVASLKIVELSKKLRERNAEVETLKTKISRLEQHIFELKEKPMETAEKAFEIEEKPANELEESIKKLEDKVNYHTNKLTEARNSNMQLKNDLKVANKWLQQEIGENFDSIQSLTNSSGGWRGRAQIIIDLQQKNNELREKLKNSQDKNSKSSIESLTSKAESKISSLCKVNDDLKMQYEELKKKYDALRARCRALETDAILLKSKYTMTKEQSQRDQDIISTLSTQICNTRELKNDVLKEKDGMIIKVQKEREVLTGQIEEYKAIIKKLKDDLAENMEKVEQLVAEQLCHNCGQDYQKDNKISRLEGEHQKLLELTEIQNERLTAEREAHSKTQTQLRYEKQRAAKAEANVARMELESTTSRSYSTVGSHIRPSDYTLKDRLELAEENIKALRTRLEIEQLERKNDLQQFVRALQNCDGNAESDT